MLTVAYRGDKTYKVLYENVSEIKSKMNKTTVSIFNVSLLSCMKLYINSIHEGIKITLKNRNGPVSIKTPLTVIITENNLKKTTTLKYTLSSVESMKRSKVPYLLTCGNIKSSSCCFTADRKLISALPPTISQMDH